MGPSDVDEDAFNKLVATATASTSDASGNHLRMALEEELALVDEMQAIAEVDRYKPDCRIQVLVDWIGENMCPALRASNGQPCAVERNTGDYFYRIRRYPALH